MSQRNKNLELLETLKEYLGAEKLLDELVNCTMSAHEAQENLEHIATMWDIGTGTEESEEENE